MSTDTFADLIARLEKASGPDREIDLALSVIWFNEPEERFLTDELWRREFSIAQKYTASPEAALRLIPVGYGAISCHIDEHGGSSARLSHPYVFGNGRTFALALCIAALKARASLAKDSQP